MAMAAVVIITGGAMVMAMAVGITAAVVMAPGKGSGKNLKKSSLRKKRGFPSGFPMQKRVQIKVIGAPLNISPV